MISGTGIMARKCDAGGKNPFSAYQNPLLKGVKGKKSIDFALFLKLCVKQ